MLNGPEIFISKIASAQRQLDAAIRMVFHEEDEPAIYTVAAAAHRVLRDLMEKRGRSAGAEAMRDGIRGIANALVQGTLPDSHRELFERENFWPAVLALAESIRDGRGDALVTSNPQSFDRMFWDRQNKVSNFLKHADRDSANTIAQEQIHVEQVLASALMTYGQLMGKLTIEMQVYGAFIALENDYGPRLPEYLVTMCTGLRNLPRARRPKAYLQMIASLKKADRTGHATPRWS